MKTEKLTLTIESITGSEIECCASNKSGNICFSYDPSQKELKFTDNSSLAEIILKYQFQFDKVILSALRGKIKPGRIISCVFIEGFNFLNQTDYNCFIRLDRRNGYLKISSSKEETKEIYKIYTDGSFARNTMTSGYGGIVQNIEGTKEVFSKSFADGGSNLMELMAVLDGLKRLQAHHKIQVNTDSRFVIRGAAQWMHFWKHNNWQTAYGSKVKFVKQWQEMDKLSEGKLIEFKWLKGHSGHLELDFCHKLARKSANIL